MKRQIPAETVSVTKNGTGSTRREFLFATLGLTLTGAVASLPGRAFAASVLSASDAVKQFISISQAITEHKHLDTVLAARFFQAFSQRDAQFGPRLTQLSRLLQPGMSAQQLLDQADKAGLHDFLYQIVTAWYTGTVGNDYHGTLVAYKQALMYQTVSDGLIVPTYCGNGPIWWTAPIPDEHSSLIDSL
ncbi:sugar dehydrogenase complex small subunit [Pantoea cypripedii]|uniref:sugar dehydrogenase complex small subunit n=1 Tax=Pantoea cypripedii TaxID=55209 RepID=UPI002FCAA08C